MTITTAGYPGEVNKIEFARMTEFMSWQAVEGLVLSPSGSDRGVEVAFDRAFAPGLIIEQTAPMVVNAPANNSGSPRRDRVILKHDWTTNETTLEVKTGTPSSNPTLPPMTRNPGVLWEQALGDLLTANGQGAYAPSNITALQWRTQRGLIVKPPGTPDPMVDANQVVIDESTRRLRYSDGAVYRELQMRHADIQDQRGWVPVSNASPGTTHSFSIAVPGSEFNMYRLTMRGRLGAAGTVRCRVNGNSSLDHITGMITRRTSDDQMITNEGSNHATTSRWLVAHWATVTGSMLEMLIHDTSAGSLPSYMSRGMRISTNPSAHRHSVGWGRVTPAVTITSLQMTAWDGGAGHTGSATNFMNSTWSLEGYRYL